MNLNLNAIIIDDCKTTNGLVMEILQETGIFKNIVTANDGMIGSKKLDNQNFDIVLLDLNLPKKSGLKIIQELIESGRKDLVGNILVASGEVDPDILKELHSLGVSSFLLKPYGQDELIIKLKEIFIRKKAS